MSAPFKMPGSQFLGKGNQSPTPGKYTESPAKQKIDYKAQGDVIDKRNKAIKNFDKDSDDFGGYIPDAKQSKAIEERKISLKDKLTSSTDSIRNVNTQETNRLKNQAFDKLMGNKPKASKGAKKAGSMAGKAVPKYASPAKNFKGEVHDHPHTTPKKKTSQEMKDKIAEAKAKSIKEANIELTKQGKPLVSSTSLD
tara:strand:+ start:648 stop:1235 length:588 start_codon:yes stop_codon:yes gene_type:complete